MRQANELHPQCTVGNPASGFVALLERSSDGSPQGWLIV